MNADLPDNNRQRTSCWDRYHPYRPWWLTPAAITFGFIYWYLASIIENIDPTEPVNWLGSISIHLPAIQTIFNYLSLRLLINLLGPGLIGYLLGTSTAAYFLHQFHNFASIREARQFLLRLWWRRYKPSIMIIVISLGLVTASLAMMTLFVAIVDFSQPPITSRRQAYFLLLIFLLGVFWLLFIGLILSITRESLNREGAQRSPRLARLAASGWQRVILGGFITSILIIFPGAWMFLFHILISRNSSATESIMFVLAFLGVALLLTIFIILSPFFLLLPERLRPLLVKPEELDDLQRRHALLRVGGPGLVFIQGPNYATITESNGRFRRVIGPGLTELCAYEYIHSMIDLRQHEREGSKKLLTKDGILVEIKVGVIFRVASNDNLLRNPVLLDTDVPDINATSRPTSETLHPYGEIAVRRAAYTKTVLDKDANAVNSWHALPLIFALARVGRALQELRYDELFAPDDPTRQPHPALRHQVIQSTRVALRRMGIHLIDMRLGPVTPVDGQVTKQHVASWQAFWKKQERVTLAQGEAQAIEEIALARREAERVMLQAIVEAVQQAEQEQGSDVTRSIVALRVVETLDRMARRSERFAYPAGHTLIHQLENLQAALHDEVQAGGDQNANAAPPPTINLR